MRSGYKVSFVGDSNAGKTSIITRFEKECFDADVSPTVGVSNVRVTVGDVHLNLWDTAGQEKFRSLVPIYTREADCIVVVFDIGSRSMFDRLDGWLSEIHDQAGYKANVIVVANKIDLEAAVATSEIKAFCKSRNLPVFFSSAVSGTSVSEVFEEIARIVSSQRSHIKDDTGIFALPDEDAGRSCC